MIYEAATEAVVLFLLFVGFTLGLSFWLGRKAQSSAGYFAAHGQIPWFVNGIAFAGDYLSAASFLGICGMIAFYGYDGFLYSIGFLAGWIVALFVVAEPMKRLGKFTFADALDAKFNNRGIKFAAGISTLVVSIFYLIPQMVGAGVLVQPLLGFDHWVGVLIVGAVVIMIVVTAGMVSTTWVQFLKGSLLVVFSAILTWMILERGFEVKSGGGDGHEFRRISVLRQDIDSPGPLAAMSGWDVLPRDGSWAETKHEFVRLKQADTGQVTAWLVEETNNAANVTLVEAQTRVAQNGQPDLVNGLEKGIKAGEPQLHPVGWVKSLPDGQQKTGPLSMPGFFRTMQQSEVVVWRNEKVKAADGSTTTVYYPKTTPGSEVLRPGEHPKFAGIRGDDIKGKLNFLSLMLALFCGTASLPHILIRYYTVKDESSARKSTIVGIASIGFFYVLTLYLGLGAMTSGAMDVTDSNMAAPLLAKSMNTWLFAAISAIAFTTVLGTVSGLILASAGAVTHDLLSSSFGWEMSDHEKVRVAKISSVIVGAIAIVLGILFEGINVGYLVGWAFSVAASANLPALVMILFWKRVTSQGVIAAILVGMVSSLGWILLSSDTFETVYGLPAQDAWTPFTQPGIVTIPLGFLTLIVVSLMTKGHQSVETA
ncbi:MAG: cation acetate symporter [Fuerstiella sp.]|jgi:cation/acetate symporter|nr:cation acetate symporter [Fuerstiella sp.]